ncbi:Abscisic acid receptor PYL4 [Abeliophyllum distichum]|uniref:Abscisic acid receptor PYL4 n=1 Tax=Abeliophyllum distichum TaxID=126358 RepID=A0ABD1R9Y2_9LAMI
MVIPVPSEIFVPNNVLHHHTHAVAPNQCYSPIVQTIDVPIAIVWFIVCCFNDPQAYKHFLKSCHMISDNNVGKLQEVHVVFDLLAASSTKRLKILDDEKHVMSFSVVGDDHKLHNYRTVTTLHVEIVVIVG